MRVVVVDTYYPAFLRAHYAIRPGLEERPYEEQLRSLLNECFGTSDAYSHHLQQLGHAAVDIVANCEPLQLRWAREHGKRPLLRGLQRMLPGPLGAPARRSLLTSIALAQIEDFGADVVYVQDPWLFGDRTLRGIQSRGRLLVCQIASVLPAERRLRAFSVLTTSFPHFVERFRRLGIDSEYLAIAFDERVLERLGGSEGEPVSPERLRSHALTFVGGLSPHVYRNGTRFLERTAAEIGVEVWGYGAEALPPESPILRRYRGESWGIAMYRVLAASRITLNRHGEISGGYANNMRLYEATGLGALLVTESAPNLHELFEPGSEVVAYEGEDDLIEKLRYYMEHDDERMRIAAAGQRRTLRDHTYAHRIGELADMLEARLA